MLFIYNSGSSSHILICIFGVGHISYIRQMALRNRCIVYLTICVEANMVASYCCDCSSAILLIFIVVW